MNTTSSTRRPRRSTGGRAPDRFGTLHHMVSVRVRASSPRKSGAGTNKSMMRTSEERVHRMKCLSRRLRRPGRSTNDRRLRCVRRLRLRTCRLKAKTRQRHSLVQDGRADRKQQKHTGWRSEQKHAAIIKRVNSKY